jgi:hypothetical protein
MCQPYGRTVHIETNHRIIDNRFRAAHSAGSGALWVGEIGMIVVGVCDLSVRGERSEEDQPWLGDDHEVMLEIRMMRKGVGPCGAWKWQWF